MEFDWRYAEPFFGKLGQPGYGSWSSWMKWHESAWTTLLKGGLLSIQTPMDETIVKMRLAALAWLAHDFCGAVLNDEDGSCPYWDDWISSLNIDLLAAMASSIDNKLHRKLIIESPLMDPEQLDICEEDAEVLLDYDEITSDLRQLIVMNAVYEQRRIVWDCLAEEAGGDASLFSGLYRNCIDFDQLIDNREEELQDDLLELEDECHQLSDGIEKSLLLEQIASLNEKLERPALIEFADDQYMQNLADEPILYGDEYSRERLLGTEWCINAQPVIIRGYPEFWGC